MSPEAVMWGGVVVMTIIIVVFMGPGLWSNQEGYPLIEGPWRWIKKMIAELKKEPPHSGNTGEDK